MTLGEIVKVNLTALGYDGLFASEYECACLTDDLFPCDAPNSDCQAGFKAICDCGKKHWLIGDKPNFIFKCEEIAGHDPPAC